MAVRRNPAFLSFELGAGALFLAWVLFAPATATAQTEAAEPAETPSETSSEAPSEALQWHQFRGPDRAGVAPGADLLQSWPEDGPPVLWRRPLGEGFASIAVAGETLYTLFAIDDEELLGAFRTADGEELWRVALGDKFRENFGNGPRSTPTLDGDTVYTLGAMGRLVAADRHGGEIRWQLELQERYPILAPQALLAPAPTSPGPQLPVFGYAGSPLVVDDLLVLETGAGGGKSFVALDKATGAERWAALDSEIGYASPITVTLAGQRQILVLAGTEIVALSTAGEVLWRHPWAATTAQPLVVAPDRVFVSTVSGVGAMLLEVQASGDTVRLEELWRVPRLRNAWNSSVVVGDHIYGFDNATLRSVAAETGELAWASRGLGQGNLIAAGDLLIVLGDRGKLALLEASPEEYRERGRVEILEGRTWTPPALAAGILYLRNHDELVAVDLRKAGS